MKVTKNLQHGYLFLFIGIGLLFLMSLSLEMYLTKGAEITEIKEDIAGELIPSDNKVEIVIEEPENFEPTYNDFIQIKGYITQDVPLTINSEEVDTYKLLGNKRYFDYQSGLDYGMNKFELEALDISQSLEIERLRNDFEIANLNIDCTTNGEDFRFGEVIEFKCTGEYFPEDTTISITICWNDEPEIIELTNQNGNYIGDTVIKERDTSEITTYINLKSQNITAKSNFNFNVYER